MSEITKLYENAGIEPERQDCCKIADKYWANNTESGFEYLMQKECPYNQECTDECEYAYDNVVYPPFTAEKQLELYKYLCKPFLITTRYYFDEFSITAENTFEWKTMTKVSATGKTYEESIAKLVNNLWQSLTEEERKQIRNILESEVRE